MTLIAWMDYCRGDETTANTEEEHQPCEQGCCNPYSCTAFCDGFGITCSGAKCGYYYAPDPTTERVRFADMIKHIGKPVYQQQSLFN